MAAAAAISEQPLLFIAYVAVIVFLCVLILYPTLIVVDQSIRDDTAR